MKMTMAARRRLLLDMARRRAQPGTGSARVCLEQRTAMTREQLPDIQSCCPRGRLEGPRGNRGRAIATLAYSATALAKEALLAGQDVFVKDPLALKVVEGREPIELMVQADLERCQQ